MTASKRRRPNVPLSFPPWQTLPVTTPASWAVWDVETLRWAHEVPGRWTNPAGFGLAVAKVLDELGRMHTFYEGDGAALVAFLAAKHLVVGFNSLKFDCGVLSAYGDVTPIRARSLDLLASLDEATGIPHCVSLNRACKATLGAEKLLADGSEAVRLWRDATAETRRLVEDYCEQDVRLTHRLWQFGATNGHILAPLPSGRGRSHARRAAPTVWALREPRRVQVRWPAPAGSGADVSG
jgi:DEAD/DEAH box helicase domain-containing protein